MTSCNLSLKRFWWSSKSRYHFMVVYETSNSTAKLPWCCKHICAANYVISWRVTACMKYRGLKYLKYFTNGSTQNSDFYEWTLYHKWNICGIRTCCLCMRAFLFMHRIFFKDGNLNKDLKFDYHFSSHTHRIF